ncbi:hypothetical protein [Devosia sediminis]|uniref:Uncharacterized protein n=1 Tax=Devosia sediminis TaxID=2798801 RepID=A0A934IYF0_9HYPH|nr:hypothetical protein [Devosia sediminis]MBJ3784505.1 hypothetical protein [Devosia sediminis]
MVPTHRFQNLHLGQPWPGTTPSLSELLSDNETFHGFAKSAEAAAMNHGLGTMIRAQTSRFNEYVAAEHKRDDLVAKLSNAMDQVRRQIDEIYNKPVSPDDVFFAVDTEDRVTMFAVPHGRRMGLYFETEAAMRAFRNRLDDTSLSPLPRYVMPEPVSDRIELEHGLPLIVADEIIWKMVTTRSPQLIDLWLNPPDIFASALKEPIDG